MMGNHIIKAARCALLPASQHIKTAASHGIRKRKKEGRGKKKRIRSEKTKFEPDRKQPSWPALTGLTPDCHRKTIYPPQIKDICPRFPAPQRQKQLL